MRKGLLFVVSGPAGSGKGTVVKKLIEKHENVKLSISMTTREPRFTETPDIDYYFVSRELFKERIEKGEMLEYAEYNGKYYGTPKAKVMQCLENGQDVILEIEVEGAMQIKSAFPEAILIMLTPPDKEVLEARLRGRGTETEDKIIKRLKNAEGELEYIKKYDYVIINKGLEEAYNDLCTAIKAERSLSRFFEVKE